MKFSLVTLLPLLLSTSVAYAATTREIIRARQAHMKRSLVDVCVALDLDVQIAPGGHNILAGHLDLCLCLSVLPGFLDSHPVAKNVVNALGRDVALNYFTGLIQNQKGSQQCHYPPNATPFCNVQCPCDFTCGNGYTPSPATNPTDCVCKPPFTVCNGVCGSFPHGCGSQGPSKRKRGYPTCSAEKTMCGVPGSGSGHDCVNVKSDAESCGGCTVPSPFGGSAVNGKNCKAIPNVDKVLCDDGACKILSCKLGFKIAASRDRCVQPGLQRQVRGVDVIDDVFSLLVRAQLLVPGFDIAAAKSQLLLAVKILDYNHILEALLLEQAIVGITDLAKLRDALGLSASVLRRDITNIDSLLALIIQQGLFVPGFNVAAARENLVAVLGVFDVNHALELLLLQGAFADIYNIANLRDLLGLGVDVL